MAIFSKHKVNLVDLIREIPELELTRLSLKTKVDYYSKVLSGKLVFYLLLYGMLRMDRLSQRGLEDAFSSPWFRTLFNVRGKNTISHSSISERLGVLEVDFFKGAYESIYRRFSSLYTKKEISGMYLQRVDSTLVKESCNKLQEGLTYTNQYGKKYQLLKYTMNYDGMFGSFVKTHKESKYCNECNALPENVINHFKKEKEHSSVYLFDRGQSSADAFKEMKSEEGLLFIGRLSENRRLKQVKLFDIEGVDFTQGELLKDGLYKLYKRVVQITKNGKESHLSELVDEEFRVIRFSCANKKEPIVLITNILHLSADEIAQMYRRRWDIEVFFRFLKQELNFSHLLSLNDNGIQVILYMTLITAMLVMIYKKENELGYKTAVRRMGIELESLVMAIIVIQSGGDLKKTELPDP
jgi:hypothetical protein